MKSRPMSLSPDSGSDAFGEPGKAASPAVRELRVGRDDWSRLVALPWGVPLAEWAEQGVTMLSIRRGLARHVVGFVALGAHRYAVKETGPAAAAREIRALEQLRLRGCRALEPVGYVVTRGEPIAIGEVAGQIAYLSGDTGYCITRLAERVLPQSILYSYPFTEPNKRLLLNAVAVLLVELHEAGVYWGDPSLANILMDLSDRRLTALLADAETVEALSVPLDERLRQQDVAAFLEAMEWQAEDIRLARGLAEDMPLVTDADADYFLARYAALCEERRVSAAHAGGALYSRLLDFERRAQQLYALGYALGAGVWGRGTRHAERADTERADTTQPAEPDHRERMAPDGEQTRQESQESFAVATVRPGWYIQQLRELLGVRVPQARAARLYQHLSVHKWLMSERMGYDVGIEAAARDWDEHYFKPALNFLAAYLPEADSASRYEALVAILDHVWEMSVREGRTVALEEGAMDYALARTPGPTTS